MLGQKTAEKGPGIGTFKRDAHEETVEIDMSSPPAAAKFDATAAHAARVGEEALRPAARRDSSSGRAEDPWVREPRSVIWTMGGPSVGEAEPRPREDMEIRGVYSHSASNGSSGGIRLGGVIASDVGDAVRIKDLRKFPTTTPIPQISTTSFSTGRISPRKLCVTCGRRSVTSGRAAPFHIV